MRGPENPHSAARDKKRENPGCGWVLRSLCVFVSLLVGVGRCWYVLVGVGMCWYVR